MVDIERLSIAVDSTLLNFSVSCVKYNRTQLDFRCHSSRESINVKFKKQKKLSRPFDNYLRYRDTVYATKHVFVRSSR